ncbi:leucyl/phenylalanyl-tRNA--protein transferase [Oleiagrimonas sp.]|jgi:leucyl/phenylalanyl-tRNA--protein transferase|uniref:leucyl/phenylalanyl-tRNA--protein transferase n=1 Tax=Oleiagrimonas sp. TaxID=2010330 RepID=UPI002620325A|nr:leucyl/phenylalanyl-tRNA--protein transferase [Oleiagrimonas sp.]MDA3913436.1 leucyl/phenylalanyl-tRNA--protein transferase [Oleiagrimonas sp.]
MNALPIEVIAAGAPPNFPPTERALAVPNGLLALGGDLAPERLLAAYAHGIFPWYGENEPILWWSPDPRCVFDTDAIHVSRSLRRQLRHSRWTLSINQAFDAVIEACAAPREDAGGTWIVPSMMAAYRNLHRLGHAHSMEVWDGEHLVGGLYGVAVGRLFCGESMFSRENGGSKIALLGLCRHLQRHGYPLLDAQVTNPHLLRMGAREVPRARFMVRVNALVERTPDGDPWTCGVGTETAAGLLE